MRMESFENSMETDQTVLYEQSGLCCLIMTHGRCILYSMSCRTSKDYNLKLKYRNILKYENGIF